MGRQKRQNRICQRRCPGQARLRASQRRHRNRGDSQPYPRMSLSVSCHGQLGAENKLISYCATNAVLAIDRLGQGGCLCKGSGLFAGSDQPLRDCLDDLLMYFLDGQIALDQHHAVGLSLGDLAVFFPNAAKERVLLLLETAFV